MNTFLVLGITTAYEYEIWIQILNESNIKS